MLRSSALLALVAVLLLTLGANATQGEFPIDTCLTVTNPALALGSRINRSVRMTRRATAFPPRFRRR